MKQETILIVDDSLEMRRALNHYMLAPLGYNVVQATDGQNGLETALKQRPDLIITDMNMPKMNGLEMITALHKANTQIPVILMTLHGSETIAIEAFRLGIRDYLIKPFTTQEVEQTVNRALTETRLHKEKEELTRSLAQSEAVRQTAITLAHYINNYLMVLSGNFNLLEEILQQEQFDHPSLEAIFEDGKSSAKHIETVLKVLQRVTKIEQTVYHGKVKMIDIEAALKDELGKPAS